MPSTRQSASRQAAKASGRMSSRVSPFWRRSLNSPVLAWSSWSLRALYSSSRDRTLSTRGMMALTSRWELVPKIFLNTFISRYTSMLMLICPIYRGKTALPRTIILVYHIPLGEKRANCKLSPTQFPIFQGGPPGFPPQMYKCSPGVDKICPLWYRIRDK